MGEGGSTPTDLQKGAMQEAEGAELIMPPNYLVITKLQVRAKRKWLSKQTNGQYHRSFSPVVKLGLLIYAKAEWPFQSEN